MLGKVLWISPQPFPSLLLINLKFLLAFVRLERSWEQFERLKTFIIFHYIYFLKFGLSRGTNKTAVYNESSPKAFQFRSFSNPKHLSSGQWQKDFNSHSNQWVLWTNQRSKRHPQECKGCILHRIQKFTLRVI